jgi:hypothetical protein
VPALSGYVRSHAVQQRHGRDVVWLEVTETARGHRSCPREEFSAPIGVRASACRIDPTSVRLGYVILLLSPSKRVIPVSRMEVIGAA